MANDGLSAPGLSSRDKLCRARTWAGQLSDIQGMQEYAVLGRGLISLSSVELEALQRDWRIDAQFDALRARGHV